MIYTEYRPIRPYRCCVLFCSVLGYGLCCVVLCWNSVERAGGETPPLVREKESSLQPVARSPAFSHVAQSQHGPFNCSSTMYQVKRAWYIPGCATTVSTNDANVTLIYFR